MGAPEKKTFFYCFDAAQKPAGGDTWSVYHDKNCVKSVMIVIAFILLGALLALISIYLMLNGGEPFTPLSKRFIVGVPLTFVSSHVAFAGISTLNKMMSDGIEEK